MNLAVEVAVVPLHTVDVKLLNQSVPTWFMLPFPYNSLAYKPFFHVPLEYTEPWMPVAKPDLFPYFFFILVFSRHFTPLSFSISYLLLLTPPFQGKADGVSATAGWRARGTEKSLQPWTWELLPQKVAHAAL